MSDNKGGSNSSTHRIKENSEVITELYKTRDDQNWKLEESLGGLSSKGKCFGTRQLQLPKNHDVSRVSMSIRPRGGLLGISTPNDRPIPAWSSLGAAFLSQTAACLIRLSIHSQFPLRCSSCVRRVSTTTPISLPKSSTYVMDPSTKCMAFLSCIVPAASHACIFDLSQYPTVVSNGSLFYFYIVFLRSKNIQER